MALHGLKLFLKLFHGHGSDSLGASTVDRGKNPHGYGHDVFFQRAYEFLTYLNVKCEHDLFAINVKGDNGVLRDVLYQDLNRCWQVYEAADRTRALHPEWTKTKICLDMRSKIGTSTLHGACGGTGVLKCDLSKTGARGISSCRMGCQEEETLTHIIMDCTHYKDCRLQLQ